MKMILTGYAHGMGGEYTNLTKGGTYECIGTSFQDDEGGRRLVSSFTWTAPLKDDDREEPNSGTPMPTVKPCKASDTQVGGDHYTSMGLQPLEATYRIYGYIGLKAAIFTKVMKYINRNKDNEVEQLKKARHCIDLLIEKAELENENNS